MRAMLRWKLILSVSVLTLIAWSIGHRGLVIAQEGATPMRTARGGNLAKTTHYQFEVFFYKTGLRVFPLNESGKPLDIAKLAGSATFYHPNSPKPWFTRSLQAATYLTEKSPTSLDLAIGLGTVPPTGSKVVFEITGLSDPTETSSTFTVPVAFVESPGESVAAPATVVVPSARYVYGPGYYGYGYYAYPGPETTPDQVAGPTHYGYSTPSQYGYSSDAIGPGHRDWSTGRDNGLAKPWLKAMD